MDIKHPRNLVTVFILPGLIIIFNSITSIKHTFAHKTCRSSPVSPNPSSNNHLQPPTNQSQKWSSATSAAPPAPPPSATTCSRHGATTCLRRTTARAPSLRSTCAVSVTRHPDITNRGVPIKKEKKKKTEKSRYADRRSKSHADGFTTSRPWHCR